MLADNRYLGQSSSKGLKTTVKRKPRVGYQVEKALEFLHLSKRAEEVDRKIKAWDKNFWAERAAID